MYIQFLFSWGLGILLAIFWLVVFLFIIRGKQFSPRIVWASFGCYIFLVLLRTGLFAFLLHKQWSKSDGIEKYYTLAYSKKIYVVVGDILLLQGVALVVGIVVWSLLTFVRKRWDYLISKHEVLLLSFGAFIVGWPKVFVFLALVFLLTVVRKLLFIALKREGVSDRMVVLPAIPLAVIVTVFWGTQLTLLTGLWAIR